MANDLTKIQLKIDDLSLKVAQDSITPQYLGAILDELLKVIEQYDFRKQYKDTVDELKRQILELQQAVWPLDITFTATPLTIEVGVATTVNTSWSVKRNGTNVLSQSTVKWSSPSESNVAVTQASKSESLTPTAPGTSAFKLHVDYEGMAVERTVNVTAVYASYFGKVAAGASVTADSVKAMTKMVNPSKAMTQSGIALANQRICFAYPKNFGTLTSVKDGNNFETLTAYTRTEVTISGVAYYVYTMTEPVTASGVKQIYS